MHTMLATALIAIPVACLSAVVAMDMEEPAVEAFLRAVGFSSYGAPMLWIAWQIKKVVTSGITLLAARWGELHLLVNRYIDTNEELIRAIRETRLSTQRAPGPTPHTAPPRKQATSGRPKTNPVNLPDER